MNAEFNWWLLIVGVVGGAGLLWLVLGDWSRREEEVGETERAREAEWIAGELHADGAQVDAATADAVLRLHRTWLRETAAYDPLEDEPDELTAAVADEQTAEGADVVAADAADEQADDAMDGATIITPAPEAPRPEPAWSGAGDEPHARAGRAIRNEPLPED